MALTRDDIVADLRGVGLGAGDGVVVHSSLSSIGWVEGGAGTAVDALLEVVGPEGTVLVPTFTAPSTEEPFDPAETPSETGAITEELRSRPDAHRSRHPTHSVAAIGPDAETLVADHEYGESLGPDSPMHRLVDRDGQILLVGVDHTANSTVHVAEKLAGVPYRDQTRQAAVLVDGERAVVTANSAHCSRGFEKLGAVLAHTDVVTHDHVGEAATRLLDGPALLEVATDALADHPGLVLCDDPDCERCAYARRTVWETAGVKN